MKPEDTAAILGELERVVGFLECNQLVIGLLRGALAAEPVGSNASAQAGLARTCRHLRAGRPQCRQYAERFAWGFARVKVGRDSRLDSPHTRLVVV